MRLARSGQATPAAGLPSLGSWSLLDAPGVLANFDVAGQVRTNLTLDGPNSCQRKTLPNRDAVPPSTSTILGWLASICQVMECLIVAIMLWNGFRRAWSRDVLRDRCTIKLSKYFITDCKDRDG